MAGAAAAMPTFLRKSFSTTSDSTVVQSLMVEDRVFPPSKECSANAITKSLEDYETQYKKSIENPEKYWKEVVDTFEWVQAPKKIVDCDFTKASHKMV